MKMENEITIKDIRSTRFVWDRMSNVTTAMAVIGVLGISIFMILQIKTEGYQMLIGVAVLVLTMAGLATFTPLGLTVDDEYIVINKLVGKVIINKKEITSIQPVEGKLVRRSGRLAGSNGGFGYWGKYRHRTIGSYSLYATNLDRLVLIETNRKKYIINY
jgi:hypothetical protein